MYIRSVERNKMALLVGIVLAVMVTVVVSQKNYCSLCVNHTMCVYTGIGAACKPMLASGVNKKDQEVILKAHNELRQRVAQGRETLGAPGPQPGASNMRQLVWDAEVASVAQRLADTCVYGHDTCRNVERFSVGQNIAWVGISNTADWNAKVNSWYNEVKTYNKNHIDPVYLSLATGHYTQAVWAETAMIGCGYSKFRATKGFIEQIYVCNYGPGGNILGRPLYLLGAAASKCPKGTKPSKSFAGLCA